jgi:tetratricopeptide (TPR) repeat protein
LLGNVAMTYYELGNFEKCLEFQLESLHMMKAFYGHNVNQLEIATLLNNLGLTYSRLGYFQKSLELHLKSFKIKSNIYGENENQRTIATLLNNIAMTYFNWSNVITRESIQIQFREKAIEYQLKCLNMFEAIFSNSKHTSLSNAYINTGEMYVDIGDSRNGLNYLLKGLLMRLEIDGKLEENGCKNVSASNFYLIFLDQIEIFLEIIKGL